MVTVMRSLRPPAGAVSGAVSVSLRRPSPRPPAPSVAAPHLAMGCRRDARAATLLPRRPVPWQSQAERPWSRAGPQSESPMAVASSASGPGTVRRLQVKLHEWACKPSPGRLGRLVRARQVHSVSGGFRSWFPAVAAAAVSESRPQYDGSSAAVPGWGLSNRHAMIVTAPQGDDGARVQKFLCCHRARPPGRH